MSRVRCLVGPFLALVSEFNGCFDSQLIERGSQLRVACFKALGEGGRKVISEVLFRVAPSFNALAKFGDCGMELGSGEFPGQGLYTLQRFAEELRAKFRCFRG